jgi:hypothetical protein
MRVPCSLCQAEWMGGRGQKPSTPQPRTHAFFLCNCQSVQGRLTHSQLLLVWKPPPLQSSITVAEYIANATLN